MLSQCVPGVPFRYPHVTSVGENAARPRRKLRLKEAAVMAGEKKIQINPSQKFTTKRPGQTLIHDSDIYHAGCFSCRDVSLGSDHLWPVVTFSVPGKRQTRSHLRVRLGASLAHFRRSVELNWISSVDWGYNILSLLGWMDKEFLHSNFHLPRSIVLMLFIYFICLSSYVTFGSRLTVTIVL